MVEQILFARSVWQYGTMFFTSFGCSELIRLRKIWKSAFFLKILVFNLLFLMYISVFRNELHSFIISYSNLIDVYFIFNSIKNFSTLLLLPVHIKNISSINLRYISENGHANFFSKWSIKLLRISWLKG